MTLPGARIETVRGPLDRSTAADVRSLAAAADAADGVAPLSEQPLLRLDDATGPGVVVHLLAYEDGLVGYAQLDLGAPDDASSELVVAPTARRRGIGTALLARLDALVVDPPRRLAVWAHGDLPAARALAARAGLTVVRELWQMRLDLTGRRADRPANAPRLAAGVAVRAFVRGQDEDAWLRLNARAFVHHPEQGRMTRSDLDAREREPWFDPPGLLLAERDGQLLAAVWTKVHPSDGTTEAVGELYVVGVDPDAQGLGLGTALTALALDHLTGAGLRTAILYTEADNAPAVRTYTRAGFVRSAVDVMFGPGSALSGTASSPTSGTIGR